MVFGYRSSHLLTAPVPATACQACGAADTLQLSVQGRYAHLLWLPLFGLGKTGRGRCADCRRELTPAEFPDPLRAHFRTLKAQTPAPAWHFTGLLLALLLVLLRPGLDAWHRHHNDELLAHPHVGDLYHIRSDAPGYYTLLRVVEVNGNSVRLSQNNYETDVEAELPQLDRPKNYASEPFDLTQFDLLIMQQQQELVAVERPGK
jgi:hypothetical protein